ncbi:Nuclease SbcCD subunit D [compost metagenome]
MRQLAGEFRKDAVNLAMSHIYVLGGVESDSERPIQVGGAYTVDPSALDIGAQYTALGHLHRPQHVKGSGVIRYSGSPLAYSFSEAGQSKSVMLLDITPGAAPVMEEHLLRSGRPLVRWTCRGGLEEAHRWLDEGRDSNAFIDLEISLTEAMSMSDIQSLRKAHEGIIHIRPVYPGRDEEIAMASRAQMPVHELFRKFYQRQSGGAEPEEELVELFMSLVADDSSASREEEEEL